MLRRLGAWYSARARRNRGHLLRHLLDIQLDDRILDLGGGNGSHIQSVLPNYTKITVADLSEQNLKQARERYGFSTVVLPETGPLPFTDREFDFCFCSSVIEHVTGPKAIVCSLSDDQAFKDVAWRHQTDFAREIDRISRAFYVQTPNRYFILESHTWLPWFIILLPRAWQISVINFFNGFWPKTTSPDFNLLTFSDMRRLFPSATILREKSLLLTKSFMAIRFPDK